MSEPLEGLIAPPPTPFSASGDVDLSAVDALAEHFRAEGLTGAFVAGSTGEGPSLTADERIALADRWLDVADESLAIIVHVGSCALPEVRRLAAHAESRGARAIAAVPPFYFRPAGVADIAEWLGAIATAAPKTPLYYYHIPSMTGVSVRLAELLPLATERAPTLAGVKFTCEDLMDFARCLALDDGRYNMLFGRDEMLLSALVLGARGAVGTTYNIAAPLYQGMLDAVQQGRIDEARARQLHAAELVAVLGNYGTMAATRAVLEMLGAPCGPMRPPLSALDAAKTDPLRRDLEAIGFFQWGRQR